MDFIKINPADNVAVAINDIEAGKCFDINGVNICMVSAVPAGHKVALRDIAEGEDIVKYGFPIGHLLQAVPKGGLINHSVLKTNLEGLLEYSYLPDLTEIAPAVEQATFNGYKRADGRAGIRNELWIIPTVGCVNGVAQSIQKLFEKEIASYPSIEKVIAFPHNYGCSQLGGDHENTRKILADMVHHPNAAGVLVVALGCENNQLSAPGNDLVASTALAASGCQFGLFTTGRGTPFGTFVPTAKISTNSRLAANKPLWIDFNAGSIVDGTPAEEVDKAFIDFVLSVSSG